MVYLFGFYVLVFTYNLIDLVVSAISMSEYKVISLFTYIIFYVSFLLWSEKSKILFFYLSVISLIIYQLLPLYFFEVPEAYQTTLYERVVPYVLLFLFYFPSFVSVYIINRKKHSKS